MALSIWEASAPIKGTITEIYLAGRIGASVPWATDLRFHPRCQRHASGRSEHHPALVALLRDITGNAPRAIQRIFLKPDGSDRLRDAMGKATLGSAAGACIKLSPDEDVTAGLGIAEGVETALAIMSLGWRPVWCTVGTSGMRKFPVLGGIKALTIFADHDDDGAGNVAAVECAQRWAEVGREIKIIMPRTKGADWNDALRGTT